MSNESPFYLTRIECPICKTVNEFETVRVGAYVEQGRDTDFCPQQIQWRYPRYQALNPLVFFAATCSNCYYTREHNQAFRDWKKDAAFKTYRLKTVKDRHLEQLATADSVIKRLGERIDVEHHPQESAIIKLHLAIFDELLAGRPVELDLGRLYLRMAWVFRDLEKGDDPGERVLRGLMSEISRRYAALRSACTGLSEETSIFERHVSAPFDSEALSGAVRAQMAPYQSRFEQALTQLRSVLSSAETQLDDLQKLTDELQSAAISGGEVAGRSFAGFGNFADYLADLKKSWDGIAGCEHEAVKLAIRHYVEAFAEGRDISPGYQQLQASYLIAELSRRIGDHDTARQYFNSTIKHGQEFIYQNRHDQSRTALARKILELAMDQGRENMQALKAVRG